MKRVRFYGKSRSCGRASAEMPAPPSVARVARVAVRAWLARDGGPTDQPAQYRGTRAISKFAKLAS